jgi:Icc-related predicted phosphoesterase
MKIALASDIHLEFGDINLQNTENANVLILSGDICVAADIGKPDRYNIMEDSRGNRIADFFKRCSFQFPHVVYVMGNHEHYNGDFAKSAAKLKSMLDSNMLSNVYLLDKECKVIDDVTFIGGTLWTDMNKEDPITLHSMTRMMNDFRCVDNSSRQVSYKTYVPLLDENGSVRKGEDGHAMTQAEFRTRDASFSPEDAVEDFKYTVEYIRTVVEGKHDKKFVVAGHHSPSKLSTHPRYASEHIMNGGYSSDLSEFILDHPQIKLWTHGHTHEDFDYMLGSTRIVCNPRGYINYEGRADHFELKYIEV